MRAALKGILPEEFVALVIMCVLAVIVFAQFSLRYVVNYSLPWGEEVARMLLVMVVFAGTAGAAARTVHIAVDVSEAFFGPRIGFYVNQLALICTALLFAIGAWLSVEIAQRIWGGSMATLPISRGWTYAFVAAFLALAALRTLGVIWRGRDR